MKRTTALASAVILAALAAHSARAADLAATIESCANCHGKDGASTEADVPIIGGYSDDYIATALQAYQSKERVCHPSKVRAGPKKGEDSDMCEVTKGLSESDTQKIGKYFQGKKFVRAAQPSDAALVQKGKDLHESTCEKCHLEAGTVVTDNAGILAGQHVQYLRTQFEDMKAGKRVVPKRMKPKIDALSKDDVEALLNFYASFK